MPTIDEAKQSGLRWVSENGPTSAAALPPPDVSSSIPGLPQVNPGATLPTRGTYPPGVILDSDFSDAVGYGMGGNQYIRSRILLTQQIIKKTKLSPASSQNNAGTNNVNSTNPTGTPAQLSSITVTQENYDATHILLSVAFVPTADPFFGGIQVWLKGYHGSTSPVLVASGDKLSPVSFVVDFTGEMVTVVGQAISPSGLTADLAGGPTAQVILNGSFPAPPAPTIVQTTTVIGGGFQFQFLFEGGNLASLIDHYNVYRSQTTNDFRFARLLTTVAQSTGVETFQDTVSGTAYYFLSAVDTNNHESAIVACQSGVSSIVSDNTTHISTNLNNQGNIPASSQLTGIFTFSQIGAGVGIIGSVNITWSSFSNIRGDGTTLTIPANYSDIPATPTVSQASGGSLGARNLEVAVGFVKNHALWGRSNFQAINVNANNLITITSPATNFTYDGWVPLVGTQANFEVVLQDNNLGGGLNGGYIPSYINFGTNWTEPSSGANTTLDGTHSFVKQNQAGLYLANLTIATYNIYPAYNIVRSQVFLGNSGSAFATLSTNATAAADQSGDGKIALSSGALSFTVTTGTGSSTGGGGGGGGRGRTGAAL